MHSQISIFEFLEEPVKVEFGSQFKHKNEYGNNDTIMKNLDEYFKPLEKLMQEHIQNFTFLYGAQLERDKGPFVIAMSTNAKGIVDKKTKTIALMKLDIPSYGNMRSELIRQIESIGNVDYESICGGLHGG